MLLIQRSTDTPIRPRDIESANTFVNAFGSREAEVAAYWIVRYCQSRRSWRPFQIKKLALFCQAHDSRSTGVYVYLTDGITKLFDEGLVGYIRNISHTVAVSAAFVARCYGSAPVAGFPKKRRSSPTVDQARSRYELLLDESFLL